jgi:hypothetical protein
MKITHGNVAIAVDIMKEAATWLMETGRPMWRLEDLTGDKILTGITADDIYIGWINEAFGTPATPRLLTYASSTKRFPMPPPNPALTT